MYFASSVSSRLWSFRDSFEGWFPSTSNSPKPLRLSFGTFEDIFPSLFEEDPFLHNWSNFAFGLLLVSSLLARAPHWNSGRYLPCVSWALWIPLYLPKLPELARKISKDFRTFRSSKTSISHFLLPLASNSFKTSSDGFPTLGPLYDLIPMTSGSFSDKLWIFLYFWASHLNSQSHW